MDKDDALEAFKFHLRGLVEQPPPSDSALDHLLTGIRFRALVAAYSCFEIWWRSQEEAIKNWVCAECSGKPYIQCFACKAVYCEECWEDHLEVTVESTE